MKIRIAGLLVSLLIAATTAWAMDPIQTQFSSDGNFELSLLRCQVRGDVLTLQVAIKNTSTDKAKYEFRYGDVYYTDIKNKKKYFALKDSEGMFIAGPMNTKNQGGKFAKWFKPGERNIIWVKFPAPAGETDSIDIAVPKAMPFEGVQLAKEG